MARHLILRRDRGSLPTGLVLSTGGVLSGTPSAIGSATFTVTATDSSSGKYTGRQNYTLTINPADHHADAIVSCYRTSWCKLQAGADCFWRHSTV